MKYSTFLDNSLCGAAAAGHGLLRVYEADAGASYEDADTQRLLKQGVSLKERMTTRISDWGIGKWQVHSDHLATDVAEAGENIREVCADPELELPRHSMQHLNNVCRGSPAKCGPGIDQWLLRLFASLPDEGLMVLLQFILLVQQGVCYPHAAPHSPYQAHAKGSWRRTTNRADCNALQAYYET